MEYKLVKRKFTAPNGEKRIFYLREGTNDQDTVQSAFVEDEYGICGMDFEKDDTVIDLGAHIGAVTMLFTTIRPDIKVFAYEAYEDNFILLKRNVVENKVENEMNIFNEAVWFYDDDKVKMYYGDNSKDGIKHKFIGSQFLFQKFRKKNLYRWVHTVTLSKTMDENRIRNCKFMKMDIEGAEYGVFKSTPKEVLEMIDRIHGEYHNINPKKIKYPRQKLIEQCKGVYYDVTGRPALPQVGPFKFVKKC